MTSNWGDQKVTLNRFRPCLGFAPHAQHRGCRMRGAWPNVETLGPLHFSIRTSAKDTNLASSPAANWFFACFFLCWNFQSLKRPESPEAVKLKRPKLKLPGRFVFGPIQVPNCQQKCQCFLISEWLLKSCPLKQKRGLDSRAIKFNVPRSSFFVVYFNLLHQHNIVQPNGNWCKPILPKANRLLLHLVVVISVAGLG